MVSTVARPCPREHCGGTLVMDIEDGWKCIACSRPVAVETPLGKPVIRHESFSVRPRGYGPLQTSVLSALNRMGGEGTTDSVASMVKHPHKLVSACLASLRDREVLTARRVRRHGGAGSHYQNLWRVA